VPSVTNRFVELLNREQRPRDHLRLLEKFLDELRFGEKPSSWV
jgi:hypothetical protein